MEDSYLSGREGGSFPHRAEAWASSWRPVTDGTLAHVAMGTPRKASSQMAEAVSERAVPKPAGSAQQLRLRRLTEDRRDFPGLSRSETSQSVGQEAAETHQYLGSPERPSRMIFPTVWLRKAHFCILVTSSFLHGGLQ